MPDPQSFRRSSLSPPLQPGIDAVRLIRRLLPGGFRPTLYEGGLQWLVPR